MSEVCEADGAKACVAHAQATEAAVAPGKSHNPPPPSPGGGLPSRRPWPHSHEPPINQYAKTANRRMLHLKRDSPLLITL
jgi:hypothetical protein